MKKKVVLVLVLLMTVLLLSACHELPAGMDEETLYQKACDIIDLCNARDYDAVFAQFDQELLGGEVTAAALTEQMDPVLDEFGAFEDFKGHAVAGASDDNTGLELAIVAVRCAYAESKATYTITFTDDYQLVGLFVQ